MTENIAGLRKITTTWLGSLYKIADIKLIHLYLFKIYIFEWHARLRRWRKMKNLTPVLLYMRIILYLNIIAIHYWKSKNKSMLVYLYIGAYNIWNTICNSLSAYSRNFRRLQRIRLTGVLFSLCTNFWSINKESKISPHYEFYDRAVFIVAILLPIIKGSPETPSSGHMFAETFLEWRN